MNVVSPPHSFMNATRDIDMAISSVRPSVRLSVHDTPVLCLNDWTYHRSPFVSVWEWDSKYSIIFISPL